MSKRFPVYLLICIGILTVYFILSSTFFGLNFQPVILPKIAKPTLRLMPTRLQANTQDTIRINLALDPDEQNADTVQFELFYDPQSLQFIDLQPDGIFTNAQILQKNIHDKGARCCHEIGKIQYTLKRDLQQKNEQTTSNIAYLEFRPLRQRGRTDVRFLQASIDGQPLLDSVQKFEYNTVVTFGQ